MRESEYRLGFREVEREARWTLGRVLLFLIPLMLLLGSLGFVVHLLTAPARAVTGVVDRTLNADNVLANYEWFKQTYQDVLALEIQQSNADSALTRFLRISGPHTQWGYQTEAEYGRLNSVVLGIQNQRQNLVAQYNARSRMVNRSLFKTHDLPEVLQ